MKTFSSLPRYRIPGPLGTVRALFREPLTFVQQLHEQDTPMQRIQLAHRSLVTVTDMKLVKELVTRWDEFGKGLPRQIPQILGNGLVFVEGKEWALQKKVMSPALHRKALMGYEQRMQKQASYLVALGHADAIQGEPTNLSQTFYQYSIKVLRDCLFGKQVPEARLQLVLDALPELMAHSYRYVSNPLTPPLWAPTPANRRVKQHIRHVSDVVMEVIQARAKQPNPKTITFIDMLLRGAEDGDSLTYQGIMEQVKIFFVAGTETASNSLSFVTWLLAQHPAVWHTLQQEVDEVLEGKPPTFARLQRCQYLHYVLRETLRLYPATWLLLRTANQDLSLGGVAFPKGTEFLFSPYAQQRRADVWPQPNEFIPERWATLEANPTHYMPFLLGPRRCIGEQFAWLEMMMVVAMMVQNFTWQLPTAVQARPAAKSTLTFAPELKVHLQPRQPWEVDKAAPPALTGNRQF